MKKILCILALIFLIGWSPGITYNKTAELTADDAVMTGRGYLSSIMVSGLDGTNACVFDLYDNTAGSSTMLAPSISVAGDIPAGYAHIVYNPPLYFATGLYVDITTSGTVAYMVYYKAE